MTPSRPEYKAPALSRGLRIIEHFAKDGTPKSMGQLASELGLTFNQIYRIVHCLLAEGYLYQDKARLYCQYRSNSDPPCQSKTDHPL
ncbi:helix-turn-helix domain-containing protein [Sodalis sp. (in: enterobacteria)]|uniref:helix-turn-helix domain-containing protein n=1 Tax=Sodalis sp. (in: enterobacteria) TaxID=1898979 RepID=UPI003F2ABB3C